MPHHLPLPHLQGQAGQRRMAQTHPGPKRPPRPRGRPKALWGGAALPDRGEGWRNGGARTPPPPVRKAPRPTLASAADHDVAVLPATAPAAPQGCGRTGDAPSAPEKRCAHVGWKQATRTPPSRPRRARKPAPPREWPGPPAVPRAASASRAAARPAAQEGPAAVPLPARPGARPLALRAAPRRVKVSRTRSGAGPFPRVTALGQSTAASDENTHPPRSHRHHPGTRPLLSGYCAPGPDRAPLQAPVTELAVWWAPIRGWGESAMRSARAQRSLSSLLPISQKRQEDLVVEPCRAPFPGQPPPPGNRCGGALPPATPTREGRASDPRPPATKPPSRKSEAAPSRPPPPPPPAVASGRPHLVLPVGRLQELPRLVCGAAGRHHELADHDLLLELVRHAPRRRHGAAAVAEPSAGAHRRPAADRPTALPAARLALRQRQGRQAGTRRRPGDAGSCSSLRPLSPGRGSAGEARTSRGPAAITEAPQGRRRLLPRGRAERRLSAGSVPGESAQDARDAASVRAAAAPVPGSAGASPRSEGGQTPTGDAAVLLRASPQSTRSQGREANGAPHPKRLGLESYCGTLRSPPHTLKRLILGKAQHCCECGMESIREPVAL